MPGAEEFRGMSLVFGRYNTIAIMEGSGIGASEAERIDYDLLRPMVYRIVQYYDVVQYFIKD
jgi:hypothetical protein